MYPYAYCQLGKAPYVLKNNDNPGYVSNSLFKAVGSGKAGKALALPDFPPSVQFLY